MFWQDLFGTGIESTKRRQKKRTTERSRKWTEQQTFKLDSALFNVEILSLLKRFIVEGRVTVEERNIIELLSAADYYGLRVRLFCSVFFDCVL